MTNDPRAPLPGWVFWPGVALSLIVVALSAGMLTVAVQVDRPTLGMLHGLALAFGVGVFGALMVNRYR